MRKKILHPNNRIKRKELIYQYFRGDIPECPVCRSPVGTDDGCLTCEFVYNRVLSESGFKEVIIN